MVPVNDKRKDKVTKVTVRQRSGTSVGGVKLDLLKKVDDD